MNNLNVGGAENALVSLLQVFDYERYSVDLLLLKKEGIFLKQVPKEVNILEEPFEIQFYDMPFSQVVVKSFKKFRLDIIFSRILMSVFTKNEKVATIRDQKKWKAMEFGIRKIPKKYDIGISYLENIPNNFLISKINADKKIGFIRNDYEKLGMLPELDRPYFKKLTALLTVSKSCESILKKNFGDLGIEIGTMQSIFSEKLINHLSKEDVGINLSGQTIVSVGRLAPQKGFDLAIDACAIVLEKGYDIKWYILGEGNMRASLEKQIKSQKLENNFFLLGLEENPYKYLTNSTIYAQTSLFEGKSRATEEAKILKTPILVTNFPTVGDQITHLENGYIVDCNAESIAAGIIELLEKKDLRDTLVKNLSLMQVNNDDELKVIYNIIENQI